MKCPFCQKDETKVIDKRDAGERGESTRRRRQCDACTKRFTTYERVEDSNVLVEKADGRRELFDKEKVLRGVVRSCEKRPITQEQMQTIADKVEAEVRSLGEKEIKSSRIGHLVMKHLRKMDKVAYIRFASVYKKFEDVEEFKKALDKLS